MPRPRALRKPRESTRPQVGYHEDPDVAAIANDLMARHETRFWHLRQFRIAYVMVTGKDKEPSGTETLGRAVKAPPLWRALTGFDAVLWVLERTWSRMPPLEREALIAHELSHFGTTEKGDLRIEPHDLEEFAFVARHYGPWDEGFRLVDAQLQAFRAAQQPAPPEDDPKVTKLRVKQKHGGPDAKRDR